MTRFRYPQHAMLRDGRRLVVRPFEQQDVDELHAFFLRLPQDLRRFAWDSIESRNLIESWGVHIDYSKAFPLLAFDGPRIVADASLHRRDRGPLRLVGRIKWLIEPEYRGAGLGTTLVNMLMSSAQENGLRHLTCMLITDIEKDAIEVLTELGFKEYLVPGYGTDPDGGSHDMSKLVFTF